MIRKTIPLIICSIFSLVMVMGCGNGDGATSAKDSTTFNAKKEADTSSFRRTNGEVCKVSVKTDISIPSTYKGKAVDKKFAKLFATTALEGGDSLDIESAIKQLVTNRLAENVSGGSDESEEDDALPTSNIEIDVRVYPVFNHSGILSMCFEETVKKDAVSSVAHSYYNYDMDKCALVDMNEFVDGSVSELSQILQKKLMEQNKVETPEDLNSIGYFDIYNLSATSNFYFTDKGIVWSYKPQELTVDANVEPTIMVSYSDLAPFVKENSIINTLL